MWCPQCVENIRAPHLACIKYTTMFTHMISWVNGRSYLKAEPFLSCGTVVVVPVADDFCPHRPPVFFTVPVVQSSGLSVSNVTGDIVTVALSALI